MIFSLTACVAIMPKSNTKSNNNSANKDNTESLNDSAIKVAKAILQNNLKNPRSLQIHSADVTLAGIDDDYNQIYIVTIDYSAQNGFGGMNRDTYTIKLVYKFRENEFYYGNVKINVD